MQLSLNASIIVVFHIIVNHINQRRTTRKFTTVIFFTLNERPKPFHRAIINTTSDTGHALYHTRLSQTRTELLACILKSAITVKQRMSIRFILYGRIKSLEDYRHIVSITNYVGDNSTVIKIQNGTQIYFLNFRSFVILEFGHIGQPFFIWCICTKVPVEVIFGDMIRILCTFGDAICTMLDSGLDLLATTDP
ncbi:hypothetical protein SAMN04488076_107119, partial [Trichococcus palustris]